MRLFACVTVLLTASNCFAFNEFFYTQEDTGLFDKLSPQHAAGSIQNARMIAINTDLSRVNNSKIKPMIHTAPFVLFSSIADDMLGALPYANKFKRTFMNSTPLAGQPDHELSWYEITEVYDLAADKVPKQQVVLRTILRPTIEMVTSSSVHLLDGKNAFHNKSFAAMLGRNKEGFSRNHVSRRWVKHIEDKKLATITVQHHGKRQNISRKVFRAERLRPHFQKRVNK
jgi:hypothetical protein